MGDERCCAPSVFIDDPMAGIDISVNFDWNMIKAFGRIYKKENIAKISHDVRIGIFSGDMDPIGGTKSSKAKKLLRRYRGKPDSMPKYIYIKMPVMSCTTRSAATNISAISSDFSTAQ